MKCNDCDKDAKNQFIIVMDNEKKTLYLCDSCTETRGLTSESSKDISKLHTHSHDDTFGSNIVLKFAAQSEEEKNSITCPKCGTTYDTFKKVGRLGCSECYTTFDKLIDDLLKKIHGSNIHAGKTPSGNPSQGKNESDIISLRKEMEICISKEEFEKAAELRDRIKTLEVQNGNK